MAWRAAFGQEPGVKSGCDSPDSALSTLLQAPQDKTGNGAWRLLETQRQAGKLADWVYLCTLSHRNHFDDDGIGLSVRDVCQPLGKWWQQLESVTRYSESARDAGGLVFEAAQGLRLQFKGGLSVFYLRQRASAGSVAAISRWKCSGSDGQSSARRFLGTGAMSRCSSRRSRRATASAASRA